jgi:hypothetical protein
MQTLRILSLSQSILQAYRCIFGLSYYTIEIKVSLKFQGQANVGAAKIKMELRGGAVRF